jgi:hypothetical protein
LGELRSRATPSTGRAPCRAGDREPHRGRHGRASGGNGWLGRDAACRAERARPRRGGAGAAGHRAAENRGGVHARTGEGNGEEEGRGLASWVRERWMGGWGRTTGAGECRGGWARAAARGWAHDVRAGRGAERWGPAPWQVGPRQRRRRARRRLERAQRLGLRGGARTQAAGPRGELGRALWAGAAGRGKRAGPVKKRKGARLFYLFISFLFLSFFCF